MHSDICIGVASARHGGRRRSFFRDSPAHWTSVLLVPRPLGRTKTGDRAERVRFGTAPPRAGLSDAQAQAAPTNRNSAARARAVIHGISHRPSGVKFGSIARQGGRIIE